MTIRRLYVNAMSIIELSEEKQKFSVPNPTFTIACAVQAANQKKNHLNLFVFFGQILPWELIRLFIKYEKLLDQSKWITESC